MTGPKNRWTQPKWMEPYIGALVNTGGWITPEHARNCDGRDCNLAVNGPRALLCISVGSQVQMLENLHAKGLLGKLDA